MAEIVADGRAERRVVRTDTKAKKLRKRPRVHKARLEAQFRLPADQSEAAISSKVV